MTARYLTDDWFAAVLAAAADLPTHDGLDCIIDIEVAGSPDGKVRYHEVWTDGRLVSVAADKAPESTVQFVQKYADAKAVVSGAIDADVSFMQGRFKIDGAYEQWLYRFRPVRSTEAYAEFLAAVADLTSFD